MIVAMGENNEVQMDVIGRVILLRSGGDGCRERRRTRHASFRETIILGRVRRLSEASR